MKPMYCLVLVTVPDLELARRLAQAALKDKLVACANIVHGIECHYRWQGALETAEELLIVFKTMRSRLEAFEKLVVDLHTYDTPEFIVLPLDGGNAKYLNWIAECVKDEPD